MTDWARFDPSTFEGEPEATVQRCFPPNGGFAHNYIAFAAPITDANAVFHVPVALSLLAAAAPSTLSFPRGRPLPANLYTVLAGPSSSARKTYSIDLGADILAAAIPERMLHGVQGSDEYLVDFLIDSPHRLIVVREGGSFLASSVERSHLHQVRKTLTACFDASPLSRGTIGKRNAKEARRKDKVPGSTSAATDPARVQSNPRVSMLLGATVGDLESYTYAHEWSTGFLSRFHFTLASPERNYANPLDLDPVTVTQLVSYLRSMHQIGMPGVCLGFDAKAAEHWCTWQQALPRKAFGGKAHASIDRAQLFALKAALLFAWDRLVFPFVRAAGVVPQGTSSLEAPFYVLEADLAPALAFADVHIRSATTILQTIAETEIGRQFRRLAAYCAEHASIATYYELLRFSDLPQRSFREITETMIARRELAPYEMGDTKLGYIHVGSLKGEPLDSARSRLQERLLRDDYESQMRLGTFQDTAH